MIIVFGLVILAWWLQQLVMLCMDLGIRAYIPYFLITFSPSNLWFDCACSSVISDREGALRSYEASPSEHTHATFISARNHWSTKIHKIRLSFHKRKIGKLISSLTDKRFSFLSKKTFNNFCNSSFPSLICPDGYIAIKPISLVLTFLLILLSVIPMLLMLLLNPSLTLYPPSSSLLVKFTVCFVL